MKRCLLPLLLGLAVMSSRATEPYTLVGEIAGGGDGGWDYLTVDTVAQRLYVSHATKVLVVDLATATIVAEIPDTPGVHGMAVAPAAGRGLITCGRANQAYLVDLATLAISARVDTGANPDGMLYVPTTAEFYTFNGRGKSATVIDAQTAAVVATIPLGGKPEFAQFDAATGEIFNNLEDTSEVVVIDAHSHVVTHRWPIAPGEEASGMALDAAHHHLFLGCGNNRMVMMDSTTGQVVDSVAIGAGVDANAYDPATGYAFASCSDGTVTIAHVDGDHLTAVQTLPTATGSRTMALDPTTHRIYLPAARFEAPTAGERRGRMVPGSFKILIYGLHGA